MQSQVQALICGVGSFKSRGETPKTFHYCDFYAGEAVRAFIEETDVEKFKPYLHKVVAMLVDVRESRGRVNYRILDIRPLKEARVPEPSA